MTGSDQLVHLLHRLHHIAASLVGFRHPLADPLDGLLGSRGQYTHFIRHDGKPGSVPND